jgi:hypothetical protein
MWCRGHRPEFFVVRAHEMPGDPVAEQAAAPHVERRLREALPRGGPRNGPGPGARPRRTPAPPRGQPVEVGLKRVGRENPVGMDPGAAAALHPIAGEQGLDPPRHKRAVQVQQMTGEIEGEPPHGPRPGGAARGRRAVEHQGRGGGRGAPPRGRPGRRPRRRWGTARPDPSCQWTTTSCSSTIKKITDQHGRDDDAEGEDEGG